MQDLWLVKQLEDLATKYQELWFKYKHLQEELQDANISSYETLEKYNKKAAEQLTRLFQQTGPIKLTGRNFGFFGVTSTGKSTLVNQVIGSNVAQTGPGETTLKVTSYDGPGYRLFDMPGRNDDLSYFTMEYIALSRALTARLILINSTVKEMNTVFRVFDSADMRYDIVVNKFDNLTSNEQEQLKRQINTEIRECNLKGVDNVWFVSAKYPDRCPDWQKMINNLKWKN